MTNTALNAPLKIGVRAITVIYGFVPALADLHETLLFYPLWSEHARFLCAWVLAFAAVIALFLVWVRDDVFLPIAFGLVFAAGFWVATLFRSAYGGALVDSNGHTNTIAGIESNMFLFSVVSILLMIALAVASKVYGGDRTRD